MIFRPIFLHYLDRELGAALRFRPRAEVLNNITHAIVLGTTAPLYCALSLVWEQPVSLGTIAPLVKLLVSSHHLSLFSRFPSLEGFLESKRETYYHQKPRYSMYFTGKLVDGSRIEPTEWKMSSTTEEIASSLGAWAVDTRAGLIASSGPYMPVFDDQRQIKEIVLGSLRDRGRRAVTYPLFSSRLKARALHRHGNWLRLVLLANYCKHYLDYGAGAIVTGVRGLSPLDHLGTAFPFYDLSLISELLKFSGLRSDGQRPPLSEWDDLLFHRGGVEHLRYVSIARQILAGTAASLNLADPFAATFSSRSLMLDKLRHSLARIERRCNARTFRERLLAAVEYMGAVYQGCVRNDPSFARSVEGQVMGSKAKVLLVTATTTESKTVMQVFEDEIGSPSRRRYEGNCTFFEIGVLSSCEITLIQSEMGSSGPSGSILTVAEALDLLKPSCVIMLGIAFGLKPRKQRLGDLLVSRQVMGYEPQRVGLSQRGGTRPRGDRVQASALLLSRFRAMETSWMDSGIHVGLLLSGEKLVDSPEFRSHLVSLEPEAIGGEMEGYGLYSAAARKGIDWIIVKGVSDWADGKKNDSAQVPAVRNAATFVARLIKSGSLD